MNNNKKAENKNGNGAGALGICPHCNSHQLWRAQRTPAEKIACYLSDGRYAIKKYQCQICHQATLVHRSDVPDAGLKIEGDIIKALITCAECGAEKMRVEEVPPAGKAAYTNETGKTAFRKLVCVACNHEIVISKDGLEAFSRQEF